MMIKPEHFAKEHKGHDFVEQSRAQLSDRCVFFQYCQTCDYLGWEEQQDIILSYAQQITVRNVAQLAVAATKAMDANPPKEGPLTRDIVERIWRKVKARM